MNPQEQMAEVRLELIGAGFAVNGMPLGLPAVRDFDLEEAIASYVQRFSEFPTARTMRSAEKRAWMFDSLWPNDGGGPF